MTIYEVKGKIQYGDPVTGETTVYKAGGFAEFQSDDPTQPRFMRDDQLRLNIKDGILGILGDPEPPKVGKCEARWDELQERVEQAGEAAAMNWIKDTVDGEGFTGSSLKSMKAGLRSANYEHKDLMIALLKGE